jgi:hypothetical protein
VIGVGVGHANPKAPSQGAAIIVYTHNNLSTGDRLSLKTSMKKAISHISTVPVRIIQRGRFTACHSVPGKAPPIPSWRKRLRPVHDGGRYYIRQIGTRVWIAGLGNAGQGDNYTLVFDGTRRGNVVTGNLGYCSAGNYDEQWYCKIYRQF